MTGLPFIVFDVNETLLDLESLTPTFERIFGERSALRLWFTQLILYSEALTLAGAYVPFTDIGGAVLEMEATTRGISISAADRAELTEKFASMPPHPEVPDALRKLRDAGFRLFTLTNNTAEISGQQLSRAGLLNISSSGGSASMRSAATSPRRKSTRLSLGPCRRSLRTYAWSAATPGILWVRSRPVGRPRLFCARATRSSMSDLSHRLPALTSTRSPPT